MSRVRNKRFFFFLRVSIDKRGMRVGIHRHHDKSLPSFHDPAIFHFSWIAMIYFLSLRIIIGVSYEQQ